MRKVFLEDLPKLNGISNRIDWIKSMGSNVRFIYDDIEGNIKLIKSVYEKGSYLYVKYLDKEDFKIATNSFANCYLGKLLDIYTGDFKVDVTEIIKDNKRNLIIVDREYRTDKKGTKLKWYKYKCNKCTYEGWMVESSLLNSIGCACCGVNSKVVIEGINDIPTTDPWMIPYFQGGYQEAKTYTKGSEKKIKAICPDCKAIKNKEISVKTIYRTHSIGCLCNDGNSYPNKIMSHVLKQLNIVFETEFSPEWIKPKRFDFYFENDNKKYIIETDGSFHNTNNKMNGQSAKESSDIDEYKDKQAQKYNVGIIRVECYESKLEYIKNNIKNSKLNDLFDLNNIDWEKAEDFALSNLCKKSCEIKRDNPNMTTTEIAEIMNLEKTTIINYLNKGTKIGWCEYNGKDEKRKNAIKLGNMSKKIFSKSVEIFKDSNSLGIFESCMELSRQSEKLFGIKLDNSSISKICSGTKKIHKGYTFKYIENNLNQAI